MRYRIGEVIEINLKDCKISGVVMDYYVDNTNIFYDIEVEVDTNVFSIVRVEARIL